MLYVDECNQVIGLRAQSPSFPMFLRINADVYLMCIFDLAEKHSQAIPCCLYIIVCIYLCTELHRHSLFQGGLAGTSPPPPQQPPISDTVGLSGSGTPLVLQKSPNVRHFLRDKPRGSVGHSYFLGFLVEVGYCRMCRVLEPRGCKSGQAATQQTEFKMCWEKKKNLFPNLLFKVALFFPWMAGLESGLAKQPLTRHALIICAFCINNNLTRTLCAIFLGGSISGMAGQGGRTFATAAGEGNM